MRRVLEFLRYIVMEFGGLIVFWITLYSFGIKPAIAATIVFVSLDGLYRWRRRLPVTRIYVLTSTLAIVFGTIDLYAANPFMIKYEAVVTNTAVALFFVAGARGEKPLIQELAEKRRGGEPIPDRADVRHFFRLFTLFWAGYFFLRACVYLWIGLILPLQQALELRTAIGAASLAAMVGLSFAGRRLFFFCAGSGCCRKWRSRLPCRLRLRRRLRASSRSRRRAPAWKRLAWLCRHRRNRPDGALRTRRCDRQGSTARIAPRRRRRVRFAWSRRRCLQRATRVADVAAIQGDTPKITIELDGRTGSRAG